MSLDNIVDEIVQMDSKKELSYRDYSWIICIKEGGFYAKLLRGTQVCATTRVHSSVGAVEIDARIIIKKLKQSEGE